MGAAPRAGGAGPAHPPSWMPGEVQGARAPCRRGPACGAVGSLSPPWQAAARCYLGVVGGFRRGEPVLGGAGPGRWRSGRLGVPAAAGVGEPGGGQCTCLAPQKEWLCLGP